MDKALEQEVRARANDRCEYCRAPQFASKLTFPIDHIIARQHGGTTVTENLAVCCGRCNRHKGPNLAGIDPVSGRLTRLFHPRLDQWDDHLRYDGPVIVGLTDVGRTTVAVLSMNRPSQVAIRQALINLGLFG